MNATPSGRLLLCATPLGNLEDITLRTLRALRESDVILAEDTRVSTPLLRHYDIHKPVRSFHERVLAARLRELRRLLGENKVVALVTDAGTPGISDPGSEAVRTAREVGATVELLPGPSAVLAAAVLSGFDVSRFRFDGFPPRATAELARYLDGLRAERSATVWFESPHRLHTFLAAVDRALPDRRLFALREFTKMFEEQRWGTAAALRATFANPRGEFTLVLEGGESGARAAAAFSPSSTQLRAAVAALRAHGLGAADITAVLRPLTGLPRKELYKLAIEAKPARG